MKSVLWLSVLLSIASLQVSVAQEFGIGGRFGINNSTILAKNPDRDNYGFVEGNQIDFYTYKMFNRFAGIESGMMLTREGFRYNNYVKITYLAIPISARFKFGYFTLNPGIRGSLLMKVKGSWKSDFTDEDISVFISPGFQFPFGMTLSSTVNVGLKDMTGSDYFPGKHTNFSVHFSVGYTFYRKGG